ncbi:hypothetical protein QBC11_003927, partial [Escherichia coli]|nr:hypothetical protein [Escherichia coli]
EIDLYLLDITINSWAPISKCVNFKNINGVNDNFLKKITCEYGKNYLGHCEESGFFVPLGVILLPKWYNHFNLNCHVLNGVDIDGRRWQLDLTSGALNLVDCYNDLDVHFIMMRVNCD